MKLFVTLIVFSLLVSCANSKWPSEKFIQKNNYKEIAPLPDEESEYEMLDKNPMYPNGEQGIVDLLMKNLSYPTEALEKGISGKVLVSYVVGVDGYVKQIEVIESVHPLLDNEAIRIIKLMERWIPGYFKGQPVNVRYKQPFSFTIK